MVAGIHVVVHEVSVEGVPQRGGNAGAAFVLRVAADFQAAQAQGVQGEVRQGLRDLAGVAAPGVRRGDPVPDLAPGISQFRAW